MNNCQRFLKKAEKLLKEEKGTSITSYSPSWSRERYRYLSTDGSVVICEHKDNSPFSIAPGIHSANVELLKKQCNIFDAHKLFFLFVEEVDDFLDKAGNRPHDDYDWEEPVENPSFRRTR